MELRQLEYFVAVAEEANFTRAAQRVHVAQPGVSAQIRRLERELGQPLLDRSGRAVRLTEVGASVLPYARAALAAAAGARQAVDQLTGLVTGRVAVGTVTSHNVDLPRLLAEFHDDYPGVDITLTQDNTDRLVEDVRAGRLDVGIIAFEHAPPDLEVHVVAREPIAAAVSPAHELATRSEIALAQLRERTLIALPAGTGIRTILERACAGAGFTPSVAFEASAPSVLADLAARGLGVAVLPWSVASGRDDLHALAITGPALRGCLGFAWRAHGPISPAARALIARLRQVTGENSLVYQKRAD